VKLPHSPLLLLVGWRARCRLAAVGGLAILATGAAAQTAEVRQEREAIYNDLTARQDALSNTLQELSRSMIDVEQWLARRGIALTDLAARLADGTTERERLAAVVAATEPQVAARRRRLSVDPDMGETVLVTNNLELERRREEIEELQRKLREIPRDVGLQTAVSLAGLSSHPFLLTGDRIAPFQEPYFSSREVRVRGADLTLQVRRRFDRESDAGSIQEAIEPGGVLAELVDGSGFDPAQTYVTLWVCADAIAGYRKVSEFLKSRGVRYTWTTDVDEPWTTSPEGPEFESWGYEAP
jgi:hypothetical protein